MQSTSRSFDRAVALLAQAELRPRFDQATFTLARQHATEELQTALNGSSSLANRRSARLLLPAGDPELREPTVDSLAALSLDDVKAYYAKTMRPDLTTIVVVGNVTPDVARAAIEREFGPWHATGSAPDVRLAPVPLNPPGEVRLSLPIAQDSVIFQQIVDITRTSPESAPCCSAIRFWAADRSGPNQKRLPFATFARTRGWCTASTLSCLEPRALELSIEYACLPANQARIGALIDAEIRRMQTEPAGSFELSLAKASTVRQTVIADSSINSIGAALLDDAENGFPFDQRQIDARNFLRVDARAVVSAMAVAMFIPIISCA